MYLSPTGHLHLDYGSEDSRYVWDARKETKGLVGCRTWSNHDWGVRENRAGALRLWGLCPDSLTPQCDLGQVV